MMAAFLSNDTTEASMLTQSYPDSGINMSQLLDKENHLEKYFGKGYVSSQAQNCLERFPTCEPPKQHLQF